MSVSKSKDYNDGSFHKPLAIFLDSKGIHRAVGEIWYDHAGNECSFRSNGTILCRTINNEPSMAIQSEKDSCDLNMIINRFGLEKVPVSSISAALTQQGYLSSVSGVYGDFSDASDYHTTLLRAQEAQEAFMELPAAIRARFSNDPGQLIDFIADDNNRSEAIELGLISGQSSSPQASKVPQGEVPASTSLDVTGGTDSKSSN